MDAEVVRERLGEMWARQSLDNEGDGLTLGVELAPTGELVGDVLLMWTSAEHRTGELLGYVFHPDHAGHVVHAEQRRTGSCISPSMISAFTGSRARLDADNHASARCRRSPQSMRQEAHLVQNEWFKGRWGDELDFAILEHEWQAMHRNGCP